MSIKIMSRVWESSELKGSELLLLLAISDNARDDGHAWPGLSTLAEKTRLSRQTVSKKLSALVEAGELYIHAKKGFVHHYVVLVDMDPKQQADTIAKIEENRGQKTEYETGGSKDGVTVEPIATGRWGSQTRGDGGSKDGATRSVINRKGTTTTGGGFNIFSAYSSVMGLMVNSPYEKQKLEQIEEDFPEEWIIDAMKICVENNKRKLSYMLGVLNRWKSEGRDSKPTAAVRPTRSRENVVT